MDGRELGCIVSCMEGRELGCCDGNPLGNDVG